MTTFGWVILGVVGLGILYGLFYIFRWLNCWLFRINEVLDLLVEIRDAIDPGHPAEAPGSDEPRKNSPAVTR